MRTIKYIVIHCTNTSQNSKIEAIKNYWKTVKGWKAPGYHIIIKPDGEPVELLPIEKVSNGVEGYNKVSIHIAYIGGIDSKKKSVDNRTTEQKETMLMLINSLKQMFPDAIVQGHRDFTGVKKDCPCFDVKTWLTTIQ